MARVNIWRGWFLHMENFTWNGSLIYLLLDHGWFDPFIWNCQKFRFPLCFLHCCYTAHWNPVSLSMKNHFHKKLNLSSIVILGLALEMTKSFYFLRIGNDLRHISVGQTSFYCSSVWLFIYAGCFIFQISKEILDELIWMGFPIR